MLDSEGEVQPGFSSEACDAIDGDSLSHQVRWEGRDLSGVRRPFRLRLLMRRAKLYAFRIK